MAPAGSGGGHLQCKSELSLCQPFYRRNVNGRAMGSIKHHANLTQIVIRNTGVHTVAVVQLHSELCTSLLTPSTVIWRYGVIYGLDRHKLSCRR